MSKQASAEMRRRRLLSAAIVVAVSAPAAAASQPQALAMNPQINVESKFTTGGIAAMRQRSEMPAYFERIKAIAQMEAMTCDVASTIVA